MPVPTPYRPILPTLILLYSLITPSSSTKETYPLELIPAGCVQISPNFFCDQSEVSNFAWREYEFWTGRVYGKNSPEYRAILPDTTVWHKYYCMFDMVPYYLRHPAYNGFPVVGVTQEQAKEYAHWRSDRVFEYLLVKWGKISYDSAQTARDHFRIDAYYKGGYSHALPGQTPPEYYPEYALPTLEERRFILHHSDSVDNASLAKYAGKWNSRRMPAYPQWQCGIIPCQGYSFKAEPMKPVDVGSPAPQNQALYHLRGNAAEWMAEPGMVTGGGWIHDKSRILATDTFHLNKPNAWTGFRNVCRWKRWTGER